MLRKRWSRLQYTIVAASLIYAAVFVAVLVLHPGSRKAYEAFFNTYQIIPPLFAGVCGLLYARRGAHSTLPRRLGWLLIGLACVCSTIGQSTWTYFESIRGIEVPSPGWPDAGYVSAYPLLIGGVFLLFGSMPIAGRARQLLDGAIATSSVAVLSWYFVVERLWEKSDVSLLGKLVSVAYPLGDIASLFGAVVLLTSMGTNRSLRRAGRFLACGLVLFTFFDTTYTYLSLHNAYQTGSWCDWAWSFGFILIGYASLTQLWWPGEDAQAEEVAAPRAALSRGPWRIMTPYVAVFTAFSVVVGHDYAQDGIISNTTFAAGIALILLVILRQVLTLLENKHLTDHLEEIVARRTEQITALHQLTKAVNNTLQVDQVVSAAAKHTLQALRADAVILRLIDHKTLDMSETPRIYLQTGLEDYPELRAFIETLPLCHQVEAIPFPEHFHSEEKPGFGLRAPLMWQQHPVGILGVIRWGGRFGETDSHLLESIALETGTAVENARSYGAALEAADRDSVTNLYNHRAIHQRLDKELKHAGKQGHPLSIIMMDMNNFKLFNDTYGHPVGDQVLKRVAQALGEECGAQDILGRYGGDEFIVVLPDTDTAQAMVMAERLRERMVQEGFRRAGEDRTIPVTLSFGIAAFPEDGASRHELLTIADSNLYVAKNSEHGIIGTTEVQRANRELRAEGSFGVLDAMVTAVDNKDRYTRRHSEDVTEFALWIAEEMGFSEESMRLMRVGGLLHDVGKIGVPDEILRKPGRLTPEEYEVLKRHPELGALVVGAIPGMEGILDAVRSHHERWDGRGYPDGLAGEEIPLIGRIMAVADAFSAMTTDRPYRKGLDLDSALAEIQSHAGTQFDPILAHMFVSAVRKRRPADEQAPSADQWRKAA